MTTRSQTPTPAAPTLVTSDGTPAVSPGAVLAAGSDGDSPRSWILFGTLMTVLTASTVCMFLPLKPQAIGIAACFMMLALIFLRAPVALAMLVPALLGMFAMRGTRLVESTLTTLPYQAVASWTLSVVPMFILMGLLLWRAGLTESLYGAGRQWLGWLPGGLAVGTNAAGAGLASASGSSVGMTYALARIGIPEMLKAGYDKRLAIGSVIVAGLPGQLIPPSILLVIYAGIAEVPIGPQLLAGIGPGIMVALLFSVMIVVYARRWAVAPADQAEHHPVVTWGDRFHSLLKVWPVPLIIGVIVWGMFSGAFTATEAGAVAALLSVVIAVVWCRRSSPFRVLLDAAMATVSSVGAIFFLLVGVGALSRMFTLTGINTGFADLIDHLSLGRVPFLLLMMVLYLVLGMFMEPLTILVLTVPILIPTLHALDISPLWYGVFAVFMTELAIVTPPVGILSFIIHGIVQDPAVNQGQKITMGDIFRACAWFMPMAVLITVLLILFPEIATTIPDLANGGG